MSKYQSAISPNSNSNRMTIHIFVTICLATATLSYFLLSYLVGTAITNKWQSTIVYFISVFLLDICNLPVVAGPCKATYPRWYYNNDSKTCLGFIYGGCKGNENNFLTKADCQRKCMSWTSEVTSNIHIVKKMWLENHQQTSSTDFFNYYMQHITYIALCMSISTYQCYISPHFVLIIVIS